MGHEWNPDDTDKDLEVEKEGQSMSVDDLIAAIAEREQLARDASVRGDTWHTSRDGDVHAADETLIAEGPYGGGMVEGSHIAAHDPQDTLRQCRADRDVVAEWQKQAQIADQLNAEAPGGDEYMVAQAITAGTVGCGHSGSGRVWPVGLTSLGDVGVSGTQ